jgi:hypothetical protein
VARGRVQEAGLAQHIDIRVMDYRQLAGDRFDAIASIGMVEHVGAANIGPYARRLAGLLRPGGRLLNHGIARLRHGDPEAGPFSQRYVFPDAAPLHLSRVIAAWKARAWRPRTSKASGTTTPRRSATGRGASTTRSSNPSSSPAPSGFASGAATSARPATASRPDSPRSTKRCAHADDGGRGQCTTS